ncbi:MAG: hypothetical protein MJ247_02030 [Alphaproteobacteria bacterium]|nr:hypothetical protein [Alphaproteobacteria bacterium]
MKSILKFFLFTISFFICLDVEAASESAKEFAAQPDQAKPLPANATKLTEKDIKATKPMDFKELAHFARDWRKYQQWLKQNNNQYSAVAYLGVSNSTDYPPEVLRWVDEHNWTADRFFLLEAKIRQTLVIIRQEEKRESLVNHLRQQAEDIKSNDSLTKEQRKNLSNQIYDDMRKVRKETSEKAPVTPTEYDMIKLNKEALGAILNE